MMKDNNWHFKISEMTEEEKKRAAEKIRDGIPDNMLVLRYQEDGTLKVVE